MAVAHIGRLGDIGLALSLRRHLMNSSISQPGTKLFAFGAPGGTANLALQRVADFPLLEVRNMEIAATGDNSKELRDHGIWYQ